MVRRAQYLFLCVVMARAATASAQSPAGAPEGAPREALRPSDSTEATPPSSPRESTAADSGDAESEAARSAKLAFQEGLEFLQNGQWMQAEAKFRASLERMPRASTRYDLAFVLFKQGKVRESLEVLDGLLREDRSPGDAKYRDYAEELKRHATRRLSSLHVHVSPPEAVLVVDGEATTMHGSDRSLTLDPGQHRADVSAIGFVPQHVDFVTTAGGAWQRNVSLVRTTSSAPFPDGMPAPRDRASEPRGVETLGPWLAIGIGGALLASGVVAGVLARNADDDFVAGCPSLHNCDPALRDTRARALSLGRAADVLLVSGAVITAGGVAWRLLLRPPRPSQGHVDASSVLTVAGTY